MTRLSQRAGFSLLEVVIAVGIFATAVVVILALLPGLTRQAADTTDTFTAQRMPDAVRLELERLAISGGFDALRARLPVMDASLSAGLALTASRDGAQLHSVGYLPPSFSAAVPQGGQYFAVEVWRYAPSQLKHDSNTLLPVLVRVSWPCWNPGATAATPLEDRQQFTFTLALRR